MEVVLDTLLKILETTTSAIVIIPVAIAIIGIVVYKVLKKLKIIK